MHVQLIPIDKQGRALDVSGRLDMHVKQVCKATAQLYRTAGFVAPWIGYLAVHERQLVDAGQFISRHLGRPAVSRAGNAIAAKRNNTCTSN